MPKELATSVHGRLEDPNPDNVHEEPLWVDKMQGAESTRVECLFVSDHVLLHVARHCVVNSFFGLARYLPTGAVVIRIAWSALACRCGHVRSLLMEGTDHS